MRIIITNSNVTVLITGQEQRENIFSNKKSKGFQSKAGIFFYNNETGNLWGGWIDFTSNLYIETEIFSYRRYNLPENTFITELFVDSIEKLYQLAFQLGNACKDWQLPKELKKIIPFEKDFKEYQNLLLKEFNLLKSFHEKAYIAGDLSILRELEGREFEEIDKRLNFFINIFDIVQYKGSDFDINEIKEKSGNIFRELSDINKIISMIVERNLEKAKTTYKNNLEKVQEIKNSPNVKIHEIISLKDENDEILHFFDIYNNFFNRLHGNLLNGIPEFKNKVIQLQNDIQNLYNEQKRLEVLIKDQLNHDKIILNQLSKFSSGIPTQLTRIAELVKLDKIIVEESIKRVVEKNSNLGKYDSLSQVFTPGTNIIMEKEKSLNQLNQQKLPEYHGIVVDGNNVALDQLNLNSGDKAQVDRLVILQKNLEKHFKKENIIIFISARFKHICDNPERLDQLLREGILTQTPAERSDDMFVVLHGLEKNYFLLSNDRYKKEKEKYPELAEKIENLRIGFSWIEKQKEFQLEEKFYQLIKNQNNQRVE